MKIAYSYAFIITLFGLFYGILKAKKSERKISEVMFKMLLVAFLATVFNFISVISESEQVCIWAFALFFICIAWLVYYVLVFSIEYTGFSVKRNRIFRVLQALLFADSVSLLVNPFFLHAYECEKVTSHSGEVFYHILQHPPYQWHLILTYIMIAWSFYFLIRKMIKSPSVYRAKYSIVTAVLALLVIADATYVFMGMVVDASVLIFAVGGMALYYFAVVYTPRDLLNRTISSVVEEMNEGVLLFDYDGHCIEVNECAKEMLGITKEAIEDQGNIFTDMFKEKNLRAFPYYKTNHTMQKDGKDLHLKMEYHRIDDKKEQYIGSFFIITDLTEEISQKRRAEYLATHDCLTDVYTKEYFYEKVAECLKNNPNETYLMVCSNVKNFKFVNDVYGTEKGDRLLKNIGKIFKKNAVEDDIYGRLESDKFAVLMKKRLYNEKAFINGYESLLKMETDNIYPLHIYFGVYEITDIHIPVSVMCDRALMAINSVKENIQKKIAYYDESLRDTILKEQKLTKDLSDALIDEQIEIFLQPQMTVGKEVLGGEALVRWKHPTDGMLSPGEFISIFEKNGSIVKLDQYVWEKACRQLKKWKEMGREDMYISVNISPKDFFFIDVYKYFKELVEKYDIRPSNLKLEITENAIMQSMDTVVTTIQRLRTYGFILEMDDFGSGYSSLNMLKNMKVDILKVDMLFLEKTEDEGRGREILKMIVELAKKLDMPVIIEGVETEEQVRFLKEIGCDLFQGYYFARPMEVEQFEKLYM